MNEQGDLVKLLDLDDEFIIELRYATDNNFTGQKVYSSNECYINKNTAQMLIRAKDMFKKDGYRVKVWDAYRPISAQRKFWEIVPNDDFVAEPPDMSKPIEFKPRHLNGLCVDITLTDMDGNELEMPSEFDDFTGKGSLNCKDISEEGRKNATYMKEIMEKAGFDSYENEWWHFFDRKTPPVPYLDFQI